MVNQADSIKVIVPWPTDDDLSEALRRLTQGIHFVGAADGSAGGLFGGEYGYGANYENDVFMMHRYCWCEEQSCPWCAGCECDGPWKYTISGREVDQREYEAFWKAYRAIPFGAKTARGAKPPSPWGVWPRDVNQVCLAPCRVCRGEFGNAPHFRHKASGAEVRWYKYIGRGMNVKAPPDMNWSAVFQQCHESLQAVGAVDPQAPHGND